MSSIFKYIVYFYPGLITVLLLTFFNGYSQKQNKALIIKSIGFSYVYTLVINHFISMSKNILIYNIVLIILAIIVPYLLYMLAKSKWLEILCNKLGINTVINDCDIEILKDDDEKYTYTRVFIRDKPIIYAGYLNMHEKEYDKKRYIILTGYKVIYINDNNEESELRCFDDTDDHEKVLIYLDDIEIVEKCCLDRISHEKSKSKNIRMLHK